MSTLVSTYLQDRASAKQLLTASLISGVPKAYNRYNGTTNALGETFNVSSLTDNNVGYHTTNYTALFALYACPAVSSQQTVIGILNDLFTVGASVTGVRTFNAAGTSSDQAIVTLHATGILA